MTALCFQLNIYQFFFLLRCEIWSQLHKSSSNTEEQNGDPSGKAPTCSRKCVGSWSRLNALLQVPSPTPPPPPPHVLFWEKDLWGGQASSPNTTVTIICICLVRICSRKASWLMRSNEVQQSC
jgi:hypothetical protein